VECGAIGAMVEATGPSLFPTQNPAMRALEVFLPFAENKTYSLCPVF